MKGLHRAVLALGFVAFSAASLEAAVVAPEAADETVRIVNNYGDMIRVYAEDADGRLHALGPVKRGELREFQIPEQVEGESFRIKVFPSQSARSLSYDDFGVKTNPLHLDSASEITFWVEPVLQESVVEFTRN